MSEPRTFLPFSDPSECPKCGWSGHAGTDYHSNLGWVPHFPDEWLERTCPDCRYAWLELPKDNLHPEEAQ